ncbi:MAG: F0F1 ATP synthase subunit epsilon [Phototrophicaceae bacterium]
MWLKVLLPTHYLINEQVRKVSFEGGDGARTILPRHIDFVSTLVPSLFSFINEDGEEIFLAMNEGVLVKRADVVRVSATNAVRGQSLDSLWRIVREQYAQTDEYERKAQAALAGLESTLARQLARLGERPL